MKNKSFRNYKNSTRLFSVYKRLPLLVEPTLVEQHAGHIYYYRHLFGEPRLVKISEAEKGNKHDAEIWEKSK